MQFLALADWSLDKLPVNAFDMALGVILTIGILRGRKNGMSGECLSLFKWLVIIFVGAAIYEPAGTMLAQAGSFSMLASFIMVYLACGLLVAGLFALIKRGLGGKILGSDVFGKTEYYLGMCSGLVRFACILLAGLALLNARLYTTKEVRAMEKFQNDVYGTNYFPGLYTVQSTVFEKSLTGPWIKSNLGWLLIKPTQPEDKTFHQKEYDLPK